MLFDFVLQPTAWVEHRLQRGWASRYLYLHAGLCALGAYALLGFALGTAIAWWLVPLVLVSHLVIDGLKARAGDGCWPFALDQLAHLAMVLLCALLIAHWMPAAAARGVGFWLAAATCLLVWWAQGSSATSAGQISAEKRSMSWSGRCSACSSPS